ncbi:hypothetical protein ACU686_27525 [Yinghuangia aomiensis]
MTAPVMQSVVPSTDCAGCDAALGSLYIFFIGATGSAVLSGLISNAPRPAGWPS